MDINILYTVILLCMELILFALIINLTQRITLITKDLYSSICTLDDKFFKETERNDSMFSAMLSRCAELQDRVEVLEREESEKGGGCEDV